jgi:hypothetical protein
MFWFLSISLLAQFTVSEIIIFWSITRSFLRQYFSVSQADNEYKCTNYRSLLQKSDSFHHEQFIEHRTDISKFGVYYEHVTNHRIHNVKNGDYITKMIIFNSNLVYLSTTLQPLWNLPGFFRAGSRVFGALCEIIVAPPPSCIYRILVYMLCLTLNRVKVHKYFFRFEDYDGICGSTTCDA